MTHSCAAATEQLLSWANKLDLQTVSGHHGSDSAAVAFDAYSACESRSYDRLIIDTAGRLHVKDNHMEELFKLQTRFEEKKSIRSSSFMASDRRVDRNKCY